MSKLGDYLKSRRRLLGLSLRDVERRAGISNAYLSMIESGKREAPHPNTLKRLAKAYDEKMAILMALAGYLDPDPDVDGSYKLELEIRFSNAVSDPQFTLGHRLRSKDNIDLDTKRFIGEVYWQLYDLENLHKLIAEFLRMIEKKMVVMAKEPQQQVRRSLEQLYGLIKRYSEGPKRPQEVHARLLRIMKEMGEKAGEKHESIDGL